MPALAPTIDAEFDAKNTAYKGQVKKVLTADLIIIGRL